MTCWMCVAILLEGPHPPPPALPAAPSLLSQEVAETHLQWRLPRCFPFYAAKHPRQPDVRKAASVVQSEESMALASGSGELLSDTGLSSDQVPPGNAEVLFGNTLHDSTLGA